MSRVIVVRCLLESKMNIDELHNDFKLFMIFSKIHINSFTIQSRLIFVEFCVEEEMMSKRIEVKTKLRLKCEMKALTNLAILWIAFKIFFVFFEIHRAYWVWEWFAFHEFWLIIDWSRAIFWIAFDIFNVFFKIFYVSLKFRETCSIKRLFKFHEFWLNND